MLSVDESDSVKRWLNGDNEVSNLSTRVGPVRNLYDLDKAYRVAKAIDEGKVEYSAGEDARRFIHCAVEVLGWVLNDNDKFGRVLESTYLELKANGINPDQLNP